LGLKISLVSRSHKPAGIRLIVSVKKLSAPLMCCL
jgi:hypothetical protein